MNIDLPTLRDQLGQTDVYLLDQIMKGRYQSGDKILDAGCGHGRNSDLLIRAGFVVNGVDIDQEKIDFCRQKYPQLSNRFQRGDLANLDCPKESFDHVISSAVFHFAQSTEHFKQMFSEHIRVLKKGGTLFIRMTSLFGLPSKIPVELGNGVYRLGDGSDRFLITESLINELTERHRLSLAEPVKTVNVSDLRAMAVLVFLKM